MTHICVSKSTIIGSDNGLSPDQRQAIIWTNAGILLIGPLGTNFTEILIEINTFYFKKMHLKISSGKWRPFCLGLNVLSAQSGYFVGDALSLNPYCPPLVEGYCHGQCHMSTAILDIKQETKHYLNQWWTSLLTHLWTSWRQWMYDLDATKLKSALPDL